MLTTLPVQIVEALMLFGCLFALARGLWPERATAVVFIVAAVLALVLQDRSFSKPQYVAMVIDLVVFAFMVFVSIRCRRTWPPVIAGLVLLMIATHVVVIADERIRSFAYITALNLWSALAILVLVLGTAFEAVPERRRRAIAKGDR